jgi:hypothetical protein
LRLEEGHQVFKLVVDATRCLPFLIPQERAELEQVLAVNVFDVEFMAGFGEVVQGR